MFWFLFKGLLRDRQRSLFPFLSVASGVFFVVLLHCWLTGTMSDTLETSARFQTGHVKVVTRAYAEEGDPLSVDLGLLGIDHLLIRLHTLDPEITWTPRIRFGSLLDVPDEKGETRAQGMVTGIGVDLFSGFSTEAERLNLHAALTQGHLPRSPSELLLSGDLAAKLGVQCGETVTLIGTTADGAMSFRNFRIAGLIRFGVSALDRGAIIADLAAMQEALDLENGATEILGFFPNGQYDPRRADRLVKAFQAMEWGDDPFAPTLLRLVDQEDLAGWIDYLQQFLSLFIFIFVLAMSLVLWNAGLLGGIRRHGEFGIRLALGESAGAVYRSLLFESLGIGLAGSIIGTLLGLGCAWLLETHGLPIGYLLKEASLMIPDTLRARITPAAFFIGFIPGLFASLLGTGLSGLGIFRRKTAELFKELQA